MKKIIKIKNYETPIPGIDNCWYSAYPGGTARIKSSCNLMEKAKDSCIFDKNDSKIRESFTICYCVGINKRMILIN